MINDQVVHFNGRTYMVTTGVKQEFLRALEPFGSESVPWDYVHPSAEKAVPDETAAGDEKSQEVIGLETDVATLKEELERVNTELAELESAPDPAADAEETTSDDADAEPTEGATAGAEETESGNPEVEPAIASETPPGAPAPANPEDN